MPTYLVQGRDFEVFLDSQKNSEGGARPSITYSQPMLQNTSASLQSLYGRCGPGYKHSLYHRSTHEPCHV